MHRASLLVFGGLISCGAPADFEDAGTLEAIQPSMASDAIVQMITEEMNDEITEFCTNNPQGMIHVTYPGGSTNLFCARLRMLKIEPDRPRPTPSWQDDGNIGWSPVGVGCTLFVAGATLWGHEICKIRKPRPTEKDLEDAKNCNMVIDFSMPVIGIGCAFI